MSNKPCSECGWATFHATTCPMHETNRKYGGQVPMSSYAMDMQAKDARIAHLEARLAVEMAEVDAWRLPPTYESGGTNRRIKIKEARAATDASRRAEKSPNAAESAKESP